MISNLLELEANFHNVPCLAYSINIVVGLAYYASDEWRLRTTQQVYPCIYSHLLSRNLLLLHHFKRFVQNRLPCKSSIDDFDYTL